MRINFDKVINRKETYCTQWDFTEDRFGKSDVLPFSISDMDFQSPPEILRAIAEHVKHGIFGYTRWNHDAYKSAIAHWYKSRFSTDISDEWIVYSPSVIYSISTLIVILTNETDQVILQTPGYDAFFKQLSASGREMVQNPLIYKNSSYSIDFDLLERQLSNPKAKILLFCNPHNPTGRVWSHRELQNIVDLCEKHHVKIISDDIHMDIVYQNHRYTPITDITGNPDNVFICTSASKTFNTPSLGGSYAFIPDEKVRDQFLAIMKQRDGLSSATIFGVLSIIEGYNHAAYWVDELVAYLYDNMKLVSSFIQEELPNMTFKIPESTYLAWIDCSKLHPSDDEIQDFLVNIGNVGIMSGGVYHVSEGKFLRMNLGCPRDKLVDGLERLKKSVQKIELLL
ncbi:putative C-S lyase [Virgibacillus dakarensis]|uniref:cysteine-S-conjugate beta-lyase n=1 Tax=Lentibacillus populi TaxID=1827502 RepID=A0A9W5X795_9BACI|nr:MULTISPECIES: MalY/PatB family protein [Bacillaceae]MBT2215498.1 pyridoxal phosphate-dependent aminotransferase [Virgibacillus dakarensis]MTW86213.1 putative C-S lyase [Virgibacillus dakarensis]GGB54673.1 aminotransferase [Lentibacillus populi]